MPIVSRRRSNVALQPLSRARYSRSAAVGGLDPPHWAYPNRSRSPRVPDIGRAGRRRKAAGPDGAECVQAVISSCPRRCRRIGVPTSAARDLPTNPCRRQRPHTGPRDASLPTKRSPSPANAYASDAATEANRSLSPSRTTSFTPSSAATRCAPTQRSPTATSPYSRPTPAVKTSSRSARVLDRIVENVPKRSRQHAPKPAVSPNGLWKSIFQQVGRMSVVTTRTRPSRSSSTGFTATAVRPHSIFGSRSFGCSSALVIPAHGTT